MAKKRSCTVGTHGDRVQVIRSDEGPWVMLVLPASNYAYSSLTTKEFRKLSAAGIQRCDEIDARSAK